MPHNQLIRLKDRPVVMMDADNLAPMLVNLVNILPPTEACLHVYKETVTLNRVAVNLLDLQEGDKINFKKSQSGCITVWIGKVKNNGYSVKMRRKCAKINSIKLCKALASALQGPGTYRIEEENTISDFSGQIYYSIFFRRFE